MNELHAWLNGQTGGLGTFIDFQQKTAQLALQEESQAALFQLMSAISARFVAAYDGEPLPTAVAASALKRLRDFLDRAAAARAQPPEDQLRLLNQIARADLTQAE